MNVTTLAAHPYPYSEHVHTRWPGMGFARVAYSRCVAVVDDANASAGLLALVLQLRFEHAPARIQRKFFLARSGGLKPSHIADEDRLIAINNFPGILMQGILSAAHRCALQALGASFVAKAPGMR